MSNTLEVLKRIVREEYKNIKDGVNIHPSGFRDYTPEEDSDFDEPHSTERMESVNERISVSDERHFGKKGIIIMIDDNGKKVSAIFKDKKNANKFNRNKLADIKKLLQLAKKTKYPKAIDESVNENSKVYSIDVADMVDVLSSWDKGEAGYTDGNSYMGKKGKQNHSTILRRECMFRVESKML